MKQLRLTVSTYNGYKPVCKVDDIGDITPVANQAKQIYLHNDAEYLAGYDIPYIIDGDMSQLDRPASEQDILMILPSGKYPVVAELVIHLHFNPRYHLTLKYK
jgi:hypothetical protein